MTQKNEAGGIATPKDNQMSKVYSDFGADNKVLSNMKINISTPRAQVVKKE